MDILLHSLYTPYKYLLFMYHDDIFRGVHNLVLKNGLQFGLSFERSSNRTNRKPYILKHTHIYKTLFDRLF